MSQKIEHDPFLFIVIMEFEVSNHALDKHLYALLDADASLFQDRRRMMKAISQCLKAPDVTYLEDKTFYFNKRFSFWMVYT